MFIHFLKIYFRQINKFHRQKAIKKKINKFYIIFLKFFRLICLKNMIRTVLFFLIIVYSCNSSYKSMNINTDTVKEVDIKKYMGTWYEIARFPHRFEKDLTGVTATYSLLENGRIKVINQGYKKDLNGKLNKAVGKAKIPNTKEPGKLKVSFFLFFYSDYFILELDQVNYTYALIGSSSDKYLWILSRTPKMPENTYNMLLNKAKLRGYNLEKLQLVPQR